jgi:hypothetical protein
METSNLTIGHYAMTLALVAIVILRAIFDALTVTT